MKEIAHAHIVQLVLLLGLSHSIISGGPPLKHKVLYESLLEILPHVSLDHGHCVDVQSAVGGHALLSCVRQNYLKC